MPTRKNTRSLSAMASEKTARAVTTTLHLQSFSCRPENFYICDSEI
uniref:Uncharacterized protein n=1 Tax=Anguilla anguilla TaxID=7936 RepID=A0A0E9XAQ9_ANGAN